ncbi:MAG: KamA family radical SAM protein [Propionibacteriaceae bacterium]|nr:KamA family radical SAM protein [Propionibacteriaceae bacterium]
MDQDWTRFPVWKDVSAEEFGHHGWQDRNSITRIKKLREALAGVTSPEVIQDIEDGLAHVGMSIRLTPYVMNLIDWRNAASDPIRGQFLPMRSEQDADHPCLRVDSLEEQDRSPVPGLVHRYPDKVLFLVTAVCPVYCQFCTRSYAVGQDTELIQKEHVTGARSWGAALDYIRQTPEIEDVVISGGDLARLKPAAVAELGNALLDIEHVRRFRFATKALSVEPMKFLTDHDWFDALTGVVDRGREMFKDVVLHTHFNHPNEVTPVVEQAMRKLHERGVYVRNQTVLLRGVNNDAGTLKALIKKLGWLHVHPYYVYLCDMVKGTEHFRLPIAEAQHLSKEVRGITAGFNTPLFIVDTPIGKRDVHSAEFYRHEYGVSGFRSPNVDAERVCYYFDPVRSLSQEAQQAWLLPEAYERALDELQEPVLIGV